MGYQEASQCLLCELSTVPAYTNLQTPTMVMNSSKCRRRSADGSAPSCMWACRMRAASSPRLRSSFTCSEHKTLILMDANYEQINTILLGSSTPDYANTGCTKFFISICSPTSCMRLNEEKPGPFIWNPPPIQ